MMVDFATCPLGGHKYNEKVERRINHINEYLEKAISKQRLSLQQWEKIAAEVSNGINDLI